MKTLCLVALSSLASLWLAGCAADASSPTSEDPENAVVAPPEEKAARGFDADQPFVKAEEPNDLPEHTIQFRAERKIYVTASGRTEK